MTINAGDRVIRKQDNKEYLVVYIGYNRNEHYLILQDYADRSRKDTCEYSFDLEKDYELVKPNKIEPLLNKVDSIKNGFGMTLMKYREIASHEDVVDKINEIIEYINKDEK